MYKRQQLLGELGLATTPTLLVLNKADRMPPGEAERMAEERGAVAIAATDSSTLHGLLRRIETILFPGGEVQLLPRVEETADVAE